MAIVYIFYEGKCLALYLFLFALKLAVQNRMMHPSRTGANLGALMPEALTN